MRNRLQKRSATRRQAGLTLVELIVAFTILLILSTMALPLARVKVQREKERRLRQALSEMRTAIDRYKDMADAGKLGQVDPDAHGYPESLEVLVEGVTLSSAGTAGGLFNQGQQGQQGQQMPGGQSGTGFGGGFGGGSSSRGGFGSAGRGGSRGGSGGAGFGNSGSGFGSNSGASSNRSSSKSGGDEEQKIRFLRKIPTDPITGTTDWGLRSVQDDPDSMSWGGQNVFDVYTRSMDRSLDGTPYSEW